MRIIFSGYHNPHFMTVTEYAEKAIRALGHELFTFNDANFVIPGRIRSSVRALHAFELARINNALVTLNKLRKPDICIVCGGERITPECVARIRKSGVTTVLWTMDPPRNFEPLVKAAPEYDYIFCAGSEAEDIMRKNRRTNLFWLPFACDTDLLSKAENSGNLAGAESATISFVGSFYPNRMQVLAKIADLDLAVWGPGWEKVPADSALKARIRKAGNVTPEEWAKIFRGSTINLALHYQDGKTPCYQASPRVFEILACQGFLISDDQKDVAALFGPGKHLAIFKNPQDLREKIAYYLANGQERRRIADCGYAEVAQKHTYLSRLRTMFELIAAHR